MRYSITKNILRAIGQILSAELLDLGAQHVLLTDLGGNILVRLNDGRTKFDIASLAVLASSNVGSLEALARIIGEDELALMVLRGQKNSIYFNRVTNDLMLISVFSHAVSIGFFRMKVKRAILGIRALM